MVGKNNKNEIIRQSAMRRQQFAIKKLSVGVVSVAVGSLLSLGVTSVQAEEISDSDVVLIQETELIENSHHEDEFINEDNTVVVEDTQNITYSSLSDESLSSQSFEDEASSNDEQFDLNANDTLILENDETINESIELFLETPEKLQIDLDSEIDHTQLIENVADEMTLLDLEENMVSETIVEEIDNDNILSNVESLDPTSLTTHTVDISPPKIISISPSQDYFTNSEPPHIFVEIEEANRIKSLNLRFVNQQSVLGSTYYDERNYFDFSFHDYGEELIRNSSGNYILELININHSHYGQYTGTYEFYSAYLSDNLGNTSEEFNSLNSSFDYLEYEGQDITDPILKSIKTDKDVYHAGEQVEVSIVIEEDKTLNDISLEFINEGYFGPGNFYVYLSETSTINELGKGLFEFKEIITLPREMGPSSFSLNWLSLNNLHLYKSDDTFPNLSFKVVNDAVQEVVTEYETSYTTSWEEVSQGSNGLKYVLSDGTERVINDVINEVKMYDHEDIHTDFETIWIENFDSDYYGNQSWLQFGQAGFKTVYYDANGDIVEEKIHSEPINEIIMVDVVGHEHIEPETIYVSNPDLEIGYTQISSEGSYGLKKVTYTLDGSITSEEVIYDAAPKILEVGTAEFLHIPFNTIFEEDPWRIPGPAWYYPRQAGLDGLMKRIYDLEGNIIDEIILLAPTDEITLIGTMEEIIIPFDIHYTYYESDVSIGRNGRKYISPDGFEHIEEYPIAEYRLYEGEMIEIPFEIEYTYWYYEVRSGSAGKKFIHNNGNEAIVEYPTSQRILYEGNISVIPFETEYTYWNYEVRNGYNGEKFIHADGTETIFHNPSNEVILYDGELVDIPFDTEYTAWSWDVRNGYNGQKFIHTDGTEVILSEPQNKVVLYDTEEVVIEYDTQYIHNYNELVGYEVIVQEGVNGLGRKYLTPADDPNEYPIEYITSPVTKIIEIGMLTNARAEEREADPNIKNTITLIDYDTGFVLDPVKFNGDSYWYRLDEFINDYNTRFGTDIEYYQWKSNKENITTEFINAENRVTTHRDIEAYIKNNSDLDLRDVELPLLLDQYPINYPDYSFSPSGNGFVNIFDGSELLFNLKFSPSYLEWYSSDTIIHKSLKLLDENQYRFGYANINNILMDFNGYKVIGSQLDIYVKKRLSKELVEAVYGTDYTNNPDEVRKGQNGTKYIYSDGSERFVDMPINAIELTEIELADKPIIDSITVDKDSYAVNETVEITVTGRSKADINDMSIQFSNFHQSRTHALHGLKFLKENIEYNNEFFTVKYFLPISNFTNLDGLMNSEFNFERLNTSDIYGNINTYQSETDYQLDAEGNEKIIYLHQPFSVSFNILDNILLGEEIEPYTTEFTTDERLVQNGVNGTRWLYSDGSEEIVVEAIPEIVLYDNEVVEIDPETEFTIYAHEVRSGIKGSKLVFSNGDERVIDAPVSAVALYRNEVEEFDYSTLTVESSDLAFGERQVIQEGTSGRRVVFYDADGKVVDSLVLSAPISRIEQIGANKQTLVLTPYETVYTTDQTAVRLGQNGTRYIYSDGRQEELAQPISAIQLYRYADEVVAYQDVLQENPQLAIGQTNIITEGADGLNRVFYDNEGKVVEIQNLAQAVHRVVEIGTLEENVVDEQPTPTPVLPDFDTDDDSEVELPVTDPEDELNSDVPDTDGNEGDNSDLEVDVGNSEEDKPEDTNSSEEDVEDSHENESGTDFEESEIESPDETNDDAIGIPEKADKVPLEPINSHIPVNAASVLPATGESNQHVWLTIGAVSLLAGFGLVVQGKRNKE